MAETPWRSHSPALPAREYLALLSYLPLKSYRSLPPFVLYSVRIRRQLRTSSGLVGYSLRGELGRRRFWTLSAWKDEAALEAFVTAAPHVAVMQALIGHMGATRFTRWTVKAADLPLSWADALAREEKTG